MVDDKNKYAMEFREYLEKSYRHNGVEGIANCLPFVDRAFVVTVNARIVAANDNFLRLIGYDRNELYGQSALNITYIDDRNLVSRNIDADSREPYLLRIVTKDARVKHVYVSPHILETDDATFRLAEFVDQTEYFALKENYITALKSTAVALANTIERRDPYTHGHMQRTAEIGVQISRLLTLGEESIESIYLGAGIHDIGKIAVPIEILIKPGKLEAYEWETIKQHPETGDHILADVKFVGTVKDIVLSHHEHQDGSGYPQGLQGCDIPIEVAVVTVADCLEAIAGVRPYSKSNSLEESIEIMKRQAEKFQTEALAAAESLVRTGRLEQLWHGVQA